MPALQSVGAFRSKSSLGFTLRGFKIRENLHEFGGQRLDIPSRNFVAMLAAGTCAMRSCEGTEDLTSVSGHESSQLCQGIK